MKSRLLLLAAVCVALFGPVVYAEHSYIYVSLSQDGVQDSSCWTAGPTKPCYSLDLALEGVHNLSASGVHAWIVLTSSGNYSLTSTIHTKFVGPLIQDFGITGNISNGEKPVVKCGDSVGLSFINVPLITLRNVVFYNCGSVQPSTSTNKNGSVYWKFIIGLNFINCSDIMFDNVWVNGTKGIGSFLYSCYGSNVFNNSGFSDNSAMLNTTYPAGGGLYIEYSTCLPTSSTHCTQLPSYKSTNMTINSCIFENNSGEVSNAMSVSDVWQIATGQAHSSVGRGGGLSVTVEGEWRGIQLTISNSHFNNNTAYWGGGLFIEFHDNSSHNTVNVSYSNFYNNFVKRDRKYGTGGGGVRMAIIFRRPSHVANNSVNFDHCHFTNNTAKWGGGLSFYTAREHDVLQPSNKLYFSICYWEYNSAWLGAALDFDVWHADYIGLPMLIWFHHVTVEYNYALRANQELLGVAILYTDTIPLLFTGVNNFANNNGSALVASSASVTFENILFFSNNNGRNGGAIQLAGNSFIMIGNKTRLWFGNNTAEQKGGAIYVETVSRHDLITPSPNCFVHYEDVTLPPRNWSAFVQFHQNTANAKNNSIYITTSIPCEWHDSPNATPGSVGSALCWNKWDYYYGNNSVKDNCSNQIETDPKGFTNKSYVSDKIKLVATPGQQTPLPEQFHVVDDFGNNALKRLVLTASIPPTSNTTTNATIDKANATIQEYITNNNFTMYGKTNQSYSVQLYTMGPRVVYASVLVELLPCPFGFVNNVQQDKDFHCVCDPDKASFNGIVECSRVNLSSSLNLLGQWAGYNTKTGHRVAGYSPYTETLTKEQQTIPPIAKTRDPGNYFCKPTNRMGVLCGQCINNTGPSINSENYKCVYCNPGVQYYSWLMYIGTEILPLTVFFLLLMLFNVSLTTGTANAFVFFSQVVTTTFGIYTPSNEPFHSLREAYRFVYGILNLDIFSALPFFQYCLSPNLETMTVILLEYILALYPLLVIFVLYSLIALYNRGVRPVTWLCTPLRLCFIRIRNYWNPNSSLLDAIAAFILLSYSRMVQTSLKLLRYTSLYHEDGSTENTVVYYDGTMQAYHGKHLIYAIIALLVLIVFVAIPPIVLILYPLKVFHKVTTPFCSLSGGRFEQFLHAFYGSYKDGAKDGTRDYRFFAGFYLIYRIVFPLVRFLPRWQMIYLVQNTFCLLAILSFTTLRPYRNDMYNKFDACIFSLLLLISLLDQYNFNEVYLETNSGTSPLIFAVEYILIWTPFAVVSCLFIYWLCMKYVRRVKQKVERSRTLEATLTNADIQPTASNAIDDNSIMQLVDERPGMYNYGSINISPIPSSESERSASQGTHSNKEWSRPLLSSVNDS